MSFLDALFRNIPPEMMEQLTAGGKELNAAMAQISGRLDTLEQMAHLMNRNILDVHRYQVETRRLLLEALGKPAAQVIDFVPAGSRPAPPLSNQGTPPPNVLEVS
jgi:hypothetical protein